MLYAVKPEYKIVYFANLEKAISYAKKVLADAVYYVKEDTDNGMLYVTEEKAWTRKAWVIVEKSHGTHLYRCICEDFSECLNVIKGDLNHFKKCSFKVVLATLHNNEAITRCYSSINKDGIMKMIEEGGK